MNLKMTSLQILSVLWVTVFCAHGIKMPFLEACPRELKGSEWTECLENSFNGAYPYLMEGAPEWRVPRMEPLHEDQLLIEQEISLAGITIDVTNATIAGLSTGGFHNCFLDLKNGYVKLDAKVREINITSNYFLSGRILALYINGSGDDIIIMRKLNGSLAFNFTKTIQPGPDGVLHEFFKAYNMIVEVDAEYMKMQFNNLFNGNQLLESYANQFLNRNWRELFKFFGPGVGRAVAKSVTKLVEDANEFLPLDELYPYPEGTELVPLQTKNTFLERITSTIQSNKHPLSGA